MHDCICTALTNAVLFAYLTSWLSQNYQKIPMCMVAIPFPVTDELKVIRMRQMALVMSVMTTLKMEKHHYILLVRTSMLLLHKFSLMQEQVGTNSDLNVLS